MSRSSIKRQSVVFSLAALTSLVAAPMAHAQTVLKWAHAYETTEPFHTQAEAIAKRVKDGTGGRVSIEVYPASKLGNELEYTKKLSSGEIDIAYVGVNWLARDYAPMGVLGFPFLFDDVEHVRKLFTSPVFLDLTANFEKQSGLRIPTAVYYGARHVTANKPINTPADLAGLKLRVPDAPAYKLFAKSMNSVVTPMAFAKVYDALKAGEIDAQENPLPTILAKKFYEVQKNISLTGHTYDMLTMVVSPKSLAKLSDADRKLLEDTMRRESTWVSIQVMTRELSAEKELIAKGANIVRPDRQAFRATVLKNVSPAELNARPGDYEKIRALAGRGKK